MLAGVAADRAENVDHFAGAPDLRNGLTGRAIGEHGTPRFGGNPSLVRMSKCHRGVRPFIKWALRIFGRCAQLVEPGCPRRRIGHAHILMITNRFRPPVRGTFPRARAAKTPHAGGCPFRSSCGEIRAPLHLGDDPEVAQWVERPPVQRRDAGSNPAFGVQDAEGPP
jgi:hypothetical protein